MSEHTPFPGPTTDPMAPPPGSSGGRILWAVGGVVAVLIGLVVAVSAFRGDDSSAGDTATTMEPTLQPVELGQSADDVSTGDDAVPTDSGSPIIATCPDTTMTGWPTEPLGWGSTAPARLIDTRNEVLLAPESCVSLLLPRVESTAPPTGALVGIGVVGAPQAGFVTAFPCGYDRPESSAVSVRAGTLGTASAIVPAGVDGTVCFFVSSGGSLIVDLLGVFQAEGDGIQGTSDAIALAATTIDADSEVRFLVPSGLQGASGLIVDLRVTSDEPGFLTSCDDSGVSLMNFAAGRHVRQVLVPVADDRICVKPSRGIDVEMVTPIWFRSDAPNRLTPSTPLRYDGRTAEIPGVAWTPNADQGAVIIGSLAFLNRGTATSDLEIEPGCAGATGRSLMTATSGQPTSAFIAIYVPPGGQICLVPDQPGDSIFDYQADAVS